MTIAAVANNSMALFAAFVATIRNKPLVLMAAPFRRLDWLESRQGFFRVRGLKLNVYSSVLHIRKYFFDPGQDSRIRKSEVRIRSETYLSSFVVLIF
jgi:hypothetical protein